MRLNKTFPKKGRKVQPLKDYIYIKSNYFDMKVPVHILPPERSESLEPRLRSSLSPRIIGTRVLKTTIKDIGPTSTLPAKMEKSPEIQLEEQSARATALKEELEKTKREIERRQEDLEDEQAKMQEAPQEEEESPKAFQEKGELRLEMHRDSTLNEIRQLLKEKHPSLEKLMDISLKQEREKHERQNEKVLQILRIKDGVIDELQQKVSEMEAVSRNAVQEKEEIERQFKELRKQHETTMKAEQVLKQNVAEHEETIKLLNEHREQLKETLKSTANAEGYERELAELRQQVEALTEEKIAAQALRKELAEAQKRIQELAKREDYVLELAGRQDEIKRGHLAELDKKDEAINEMVKKMEEAMEELKRKDENETKLQVELSKAKSMEAELKRLHEENEDLQNRVLEVEEIYRNDNEKLASIIQLAKGPEPALKADRSFTIEDLRSTSKDYIGKLKDKIDILQLRIAELESNQEALEAKSKLTESMAATHQADKNALIGKYTEEIAHLQQTVLDLENKAHKISKVAEVQTALKGDNISDLGRMIEDYKEKLEYAGQQHDEREKYIAELEAGLEKEAEEAKKAKADLDAVVKKFESTSGTLAKLEESEIVTKLNSRVSALQIQVHQLQTKLSQAEEQLQKKPVEEQKAQPAKPQAIAEHVTERMEALELTIVQLREEVIQLEVEKHNAEQAAKLEVDMRDAKIKALEGMISSSGVDKSQSYFTSNMRAELEKLRETNKVLENRLKQAEQDMSGAHKELTRLKQVERLARVLPSDGEIALKLTSKLKAQKGEIRYLQGLLRRAKLEFDKMSAAIQSRGDSSFHPAATPKESSQLGFEWEKLVETRYEQQIQELLKRCQEYRNKLNDSLRVTLELKEEFTHKLMEQEEHHQKQLFKLAEETRQKTRETETLSQRVEKLTEKLQLEQARAEEIEEIKAKSESELYNRIKYLEDSLSTEKHVAEQTRNQAKKHEMVVQERSAQIAVLMETIEALQRNAKDVVAQKFLNANVELCSVKAKYAKLEAKLADMDFAVKDQNKTLEKKEKVEAKLIEEKSGLAKELTKTKKTIELQTKEIERLEKELEENRMESANEVVKNHTLLEQIKIKDRRLEMFKTQLNEMQGRDREPTMPRGSARKLGKSPVPSLNTTMSKWGGVEEAKEVRGTESRQIAVLLKQLLAELDTNKSILPVEHKSASMVQKMSNIVLKSDQIISDLERTNIELEQKLAASQIKAEDKVVSDRISAKFLAIEAENTELGLLLESWLSYNEKSVLENLLRTQHGLAESKRSLYQANYKLLGLAIENSTLKAAVREVQDRLDAKAKEMQLAKAKLEKDLALARINAEEEMSLKLSIRNEEIKTYFDTHVAKLILGKEEGSQLLTISRELCAQKLMVEKLQFMLHNAGDEKAALEKQVSELMSALEKEADQLSELHAEHYVKYKKRKEMYEGVIKGKLQGNLYMSKKALKVLADKQETEIDELNLAFNKLKEEKEKMKLLLGQKGVYENYHGMHSGLVEELEGKVASLTSALEEKMQFIETMEKKMSDMVSEHLLEIQNMQSDVELHVQEERKKIMDEYDLLAKKYKPGEAPGEIIAENQGLKNRCVLLKQNIENLESEAVILRQKLDSISEDNTHLKNEVESYKKALLDAQETLGIFPSAEQTPFMSSSRTKGGLMTPVDKRIKESKKRHATLATTEKQPIAPKTDTKEEEGLPKIPKLVKALLAAKYNEAAAEAKVRKLARDDLETRQESMKLQAQIKEFEAKLRHYERLLKDNNIRINDGLERYRGEEEEENLVWMKKRILELESICEDLRTKELNALANYTSSVYESKHFEPTPTDGNIVDLLLNGLITLCNKLATTELQMKERNVLPASSEDTLERLQRVVIRSLTSLIRKLQGDASWNLQCAVPSNESDKQVWYLELVELQTQHVERAITQLKEYTSRIAVEITGSLASAAQVKATAMELANQTKEVAEETSSLKHVCSLVKNDLEAVAVRPNVSKSQVLGEKSELLDRLGLAEKVKKNLENELVQLKLSLSYNQTEGKQMLEATKLELDKALRRNRELELELISLQNKRQELEKDLALERTNSDELRRDITGSTKKLTDLSSLLEKYKRELKDSMKEADKIAEKDKQLAELKQQVELQIKENKELKAKCIGLTKKTENLESEGMKALQRENKELDARLHAEIEERKSEIEFWIKERAQMRQLIDSLKMEKDKLAHPKPAKKEDAEAKTKTKDSKKRMQKYREKVKKLQEELQGKSVEQFKVNADLQDLKSKLHLAELNTEEERRKVIALTEELRSMQVKSREVVGSVVDTDYRQEIKELKANLEKMKAAMEKEASEKNKREQEYREEREKMTIVIQELDHEIQMKGKELEEENKRLQVELERKCNNLEMRERDLEAVNLKYRELENKLEKAVEELNKVQAEFNKAKENSQKTEKSHKELETVVLSQEEVVNKLKQDLIAREEEYKTFLSELQQEYKEAKKSSDELVSVYELQLKLLREKFREEYVELHNKLAVQTQGKGVLSPKKKEQCELSVDLMFQLSQKDAQIKNLEKEVAKLKNKAAATKTKLVKLQVKEEPKPKLKAKTFVPTEIQQKRKTVAKLEKPSVENSGLILNANIEEQLKAFNDVFKEKTDLEIKLGRIQSTVKGLECKLSMEKEKAEDSLEKTEEMKKELESLRELLRASKKEQAELSKKHKNELQKMLDELIQVKSSWKSPEDLSRCQEEKRELEAQLKVLKEELNRKKELMKQWKEKEELRQSETGQLMSEVESIKDDSEKLKKAMKELSRKDQTIKSLKSAAENSKALEKQLAEENKALVEKIKALKAEIARKDATLKTFKEKTEDFKVDKEFAKEKDIEIEKLKTKIGSAKQDMERKDDQIRTLKAKIESLMQDLERAKAELDSKSKAETKEAEKGQKKVGKTKQKLKAAEGKNQQLSIMLRTIFRELLTDIEKLRMRANAYRLAKAEAVVENQFYRESLDILGIGAEDMQEFVPRGEQTGEENGDLIELVEKINRIVENNEIPKDYEDVVEKYKALVKEKVQLEKMINEMEGPKPAKAVSVQEAASGIEGYEKKMKTMGDMGKQVIISNQHSFQFFLLQMCIYINLCSQRPLKQYKDS
eukprot:TRINITY_DN98_c0_g1_i1.p1 TRINITY_DN98_c0_g1~~TRINITY_DN98_c0_g1_i1.p1  ORF type:complete len:3109 (+),score=697.90 TRINITY_DN98_c0_g1_i1:340-9666(+)